jgi:hypothetical protein
MASLIPSNCAFPLLTEIQQLLAQVKRLLGGEEEELLAQS